MLEIDAVRSGYHGLEILHGVSLTVGAGEIVAIVGANGAGKSTALKTIVGEVKQFGGSVKFDGIAVPNGRSYDLARRGLMLVPQGTQGFQRGRDPRPRPDPARTPHPAGRNHVGRAAADARDRPRADGCPAPADA
jgi:energy-coupling factor transporter ATP-binding protein EcfA2